MAQRRIGNFEVIEQIAVGGQGTVYRARDVNLGRIVALKTLHTHLAQDQQFRERFLREARMAAFLVHPNVATVYHVGEDAGELYMAMEYIPSSFHALIFERGALPVSEAVELIRQVALALQAAHQQGIVHRDIKPQNILLAEGNIPKVADFGIARAEDLSAMTATGTIMGTPHYMSPEQCRGERADIRSDIYALGVVFYQMLTGELPFNAETPLAVLRQHIDVAPPRVRQARADVPPEVDAIVERCLAKDPARRYQTPAELAQALVRAQPSPIPATPPAPQPTGPATPPPTPTPPLATPPPTPPDPSGGLNYCNRCGTRLDQGARYCIACGATVAPMQPPSAQSPAPTPPPTPPPPQPAADSLSTYQREVVERIKALSRPPAPDARKRKTRLALWSLLGGIIFVVVIIGMFVPREGDDGSAGTVPVPPASTPTPDDVAATIEAFRRRATPTAASTAKPTTTPTSTPVSVAPNFRATFAATTKATMTASAEVSATIEALQRRISSPTPLRVEVNSSPYLFNPRGFEFTIGATYTLTLVGDAEFHTFSVSELWGDIFVNPGETVVQDITPDKIGTFKLFCVPHESLGMVGEVRIQ